MPSLKDWEHPAAPGWPRRIQGREGRERREFPQPPLNGARSIQVKASAEFVVASALLFCAGCAGERPVGPTFTLRDSAGVSIAENGGELPAGSQEWSISAEPTLQIGAREGDESYLLFRVWGAVRLSDGRIAVANNRSPDLRIYGPGGTHLRTYGTRGEGPGEFDSPVLMGSLPGDTLVVVDRLLRRIYLFHPDAGFVRGSQADPAFPGYLLTAGMFSDGSALVWNSEWEVEMPNGLYRFPYHYRSLAPDGSLGTDFGDLPGNETVYSTRAVEGGTTALSTGRPFGKGPAVAVAGDRFFYSSQDRYEIQVRDGEGTLIRLIRREREPQPVTEAHVSEIMEEMADEAGDTEQAREFRRMFRQAPIPGLHPALGSIYADALGYLWVEEYRLPGDTVRNTTIFDPEGRMVGSLVLPGGLRVEEIGPDYVLGRYADDLGVEYLRLYRLTRPPA